MQSLNETLVTRVLFIFFAPLLILVAGARGQSPSTNPSTEPALASSELAPTRCYLRSDSAKPGEVDLTWFDEVPLRGRYKLQRSADGGGTWRTIGGANGGETEFHVADTRVVADTHYLYRVAIQTSPVSNVIEVTTPQKNLIEAVRGEATVTLDDIAKVSFWTSTFKASLLMALAFIPRVLVGVLIFLIFLVGYRAVRRVAISSMNRGHVDPSIRDLLVALLRWGILGFGFVIACNQMGFEITALLTGVSIIGLAIGFAAQDTLSNFIAGVVIFWDKPFKVGDWVTVDSHYGRVMRITFRSTRVLNLDGEIIVMPNTIVLSNKLANHSTHPVNRVNVPVIIPADMSIDRAREALLKSVPTDDRLLADPRPRVVVSEVTLSQVLLTLHFWIRDEALEHQMFHEQLEKSKLAIDQLRAA